MSIYVLRAMVKLLISKRILREPPTHPLPTRARKLCQLMAKHWNYLFADDEAPKISHYSRDLEVVSRLGEQLSQADQHFMSGSFNCDEYEYFMRSLRNIARLLKEDDIVAAINHFLRHEEGELPADLDHTQILWERTFLDLLHANGDQHFGHELMGIIQQPFFNYAEYEFKCHGQSVLPEIIHL